MAGITFGTDGVRGRAFTELTLEVAYSLGRAAAEVLGGDRAVVGRDTRESGPALMGAVAAGLRSGGVEALDLGIAPTPAVAFAANARSCAGVMVSASHNPWFDNGIKLFDRLGTKLGDQDQLAVEQALGTGGRVEMSRVHAESIELMPIQADLGDYVHAVKASVGSDFGGSKVLLDAANGSGSHIVAPALADLGAEVEVLFNQPDGQNINDGCGSTNPQALAAAVVDRGAALGLALDGDADRLLTVDENGSVVDGDHLMAILAGDMHDQGRLAGDRLVVTVMSNLGLLRAMEERGINVEVTPVGDRSVLDALDRHNAIFGGEQSGHLIFRDISSTGDGFLSAVQLLDVLARSGRGLAELAGAAMSSVPQVLRSVRISREVVDIDDQLAGEIAEVSQRLGSDGRVLVRASGTEPVVRVMVEALEASVAEAACEHLCQVVQERFGDDTTLS